MQKENNTLSVNAIRVIGNGHNEFYISAIPVSTLKDVSSVSRAEENPQEGYQRLLDSKRAEKIGEYFDQGMSIPGAIILSAQPEADCRFDEDSSQLSFRLSRGSFVVIDGQHRLFGATFAKEDVVLPVAILCGLSLEDEVHYFLDINGNQKGVPRTLRLEVEKFLMPDDDDDAIRRKLFTRFNEDPESPLYGRMAATRSVTGKLSHVPFKNVLDGILALDFMKRMSFDQKYKIILNFLSAAEDLLLASLGNDKKLSNAAFFQALFGIFLDVRELALERHGNYRKEAFLDICRPLENIDWEIHAGTNKKAIQAFSSHMKDLVTSAQRASDDLF